MKVTWNLLLLMCLAGVVLSHCADSAGGRKFVDGDESGYFPFRDGSKAFGFIEVKLPQESQVRKGDLEVRYEGEFEIGGRFYIKEVMIVTGMPEFMEPSVSYKRVADGAIYVVYSLDAKGEQLLYPGGLTEGSSWELNEAGEIFSCMVEAAETAHLVGAIFEDCMKVRCRGESTHYDGTVWDSERLRYMCPGHGEVKNSTKDSLMGEFTLVNTELERFEF